MNEIIKGYLSKFVNDSKSYDYFSKCCDVIDKAKGRGSPYGLNRKGHFTDKIINICKTNRDIK